MNRFVRNSLIVVLVLAVGGTYSARAWRVGHALTPEDVGEIATRLEKLPLEVESPKFTGTREYLTDYIVELSGADYYSTITYLGEDGGTVRVHIGVAARTDAWLHEPTVCLPTHGWTTTQTEAVPMWPDLPGVAPDAKVWRMMLHKAGERMLVYYWFQSGDHVVMEPFQRAWHRFRGLLAGERDSPVQIVILYSPVDSSESRSEARVASLVRALWPDLSTILSSGD